MQLLSAGRYNVTGLEFAPGGAGLVASSTHHTPLWWDLPATGSPIPLAEKATYSCSSFTFSPDASVVGWITEGGRVEHDRRTGVTRPAAVIPGSERLNNQAVCGSDGRLVVRTIEPRVGYHVRAFTPNGRDGWAEAWHLGPSDVGGWHMAGSLHGERSFLWEAPPYIANKPPRIVARSTLSGDVLSETAAPIEHASGFHAKPDGSALVLFIDSSLFYWQPGEPVQKIRTGTLCYYRSLAFHPDGRHLLAGNNDTTARLIDTQTWQVVRQYTWTIGRQTAVAVSPDGQLAAAGGAKGQVVVWDLDL